MPASYTLAAKFDDCAREPIHIPGSIQPHGMLFAVTRNGLRLAAVSENIAVTLRSTPKHLVGGTIDQILDSPSAECLETLLHAGSLTDVIEVKLRQPAPPAEWEALAHRWGGLILVELEPRLRDTGNALLFGQVRGGIEQIRKSTGVVDACVALAKGTRVLTGHERVMIYRFDPYWNGEVVAEDKIDDAHSYLGHSFPASDIPAQARALYTRNMLRLIPDARYAPCRIVPDTDPTTGAPIDLSDAALRGVSPIHCEYLANMGVIGSMSVSIIRQGALWALVACHHSTPRFVSRDVRRGCELLTQAMAWHLDTSERTVSARAIEAVRTLDTEIVAGATSEGDCRDLLRNIAPTLMELAGARGLALCCPADTWTSGVTPVAARIRDIVNWLSAGGETALFTDHLTGLFPSAVDDTPVASGIAATRLTTGWLLWFRPEWPRSIQWAGDPARPLTVAEDTARINPRKSFATWIEQVRGQSHPWEPSERAVVTEAGHLVTRLMYQDQVILALAEERRTTQVLGEWVDEFDRLAAELRLEIEQRTAAQAALQRHRDDLEREVAERTAAVVGSEARLADVIETLPSALILFDAEDRLVACNAAYRALASIDAHHFKPGTSYQELSRIALESGVVTMEGVAAERWLRERAIERRAVGDLAVRTEYRRDDGTWFEMYERRTREGGTVTLRIDVTQAHRHEAMLAEHGKLAALGQLASGVAHEINNLLQPALIFPELVRERLPPQDVEFHEYLEVVLESVRKAREVVRNVLLFARGQDAKLVTVDLAVEIDAAMQFIQGLLPPNISLHQQTRRLGTLAGVNKTQLTQVLTNLVLNAVHATGGHGSIEIALDRARLSSGEAEALQLEPDAAYLALTVADNGTGMDASTLARIFEPFFTTKPLGEGTGLGLSVVFGILRGWNGAVAVSSELGRGTTFTLYIPIVEPSRPTEDTTRNAG